MTREAPLLLTLDDPRTRDASLTGGKASALAALTGAGQPVPPGFVLTTAAFDGDGSPALRPEAREQLARALELLGGAVAVRSSGVAEDLAGASFAGQYETVLDVEGEAAVCEAAARCLASAHAPRVAAYRAERGIAFAPMAVLVQKLVRPRAAGVAFTAHPVTGERGVVFVSATRGLGERLVSGEVDGEEWEVRQSAERLRAGREDVLAAADAEAIATLARGVGGDGPMDVEWAITGTGDQRELHVLQARPMTALPDPVSWESPAPGGYVRNFRLGEWLGAPMTPICATWVIPEIEGQLHRAFEELGGIPMPRPGHVVVNGWYFYGGMNFQPTLWNILRSIPRAIRVLFSPRRPQLLAGIPPLAHLGFDSETVRWREQLLPALRDAVAAAETEVATADPPALVALVQRILDVTAQQVASIVGVAGYAAKAELAALELLKKRVPGHDVTIFDLVSGAEVAPAAHDVEGLDPFFPTLGERGALPAPPSDEARARVRARRDAAEERTLAAAKPGARPKIAEAIAEARRAHAVRLEQTGQLTLGWPVLRRALLRLGEHAARRGAIREPGEVFFLERAELEAAVAGPVARTSPERPTREGIDVEARRRTWERQRRLAPPLQVGELTGIGKQVFPMITAMLHHEEHDAPDAIVGMPGSPGRVTGPARVVRSVDELDRLQSGEILVAPVTTPAWTLGFSRALAIVTDTGSVASHASIVAREHGIPAVVGTGDGTGRLRDGMIITVDGSRGVVRLGRVP